MNGKRDAGDPAYGDESFERLVRDLSEPEQVEAILLGGSRASGRNDENSDFDLYVYTREEIPPGMRKSILERHFSCLELDNRFWETEDDGVLSGSGIPVDIIYRNLDETEHALTGLLFEYRASTGYSTAIWSNVITSLILFDRNGRARELQERFRIPYPRALATSIVRKNLPLLRGSLSAYDSQLEKAVKRDDPVSVNHRLSAFLASYFDILFALNSLPHPGEKRILEILARDAALLPANMEADVRFLLETPPSGGERLLACLRRLVERLEIVLEAQKLP